MKYVLFAIAALVLVNVINANADKLLQENCFLPTKCQI